METITIVALSIFILTYVCLIALPKYRAYVALAAGLVFVLMDVFGAFEGVESSMQNAVLSNIDWNVLLMIAGTMGIVALFIESKMPSLLADLLIERTPNVMWAIISLSLFSGIVSAFVDNVATVLMVAPVALNIAKKLKISPVASIIAISVASNLQGAATLVGDTTSILLGVELDMTFFDFFWYHGRMGLFWIVEIGALAATLILFWIFRKDKQPVSVEDKTVVTDYMPSFLLIGMIALLIIASFIEGTPQITNGLICTGLFIFGVLITIIRKPSNAKAKVLQYLKEIDYFTLLLLFGLFLVIGGISRAGVIDEISKLFVKVGGDNPFVMFTLIVWFSVFISAFIDNIPYVMTMLKVVNGIGITLASEFGEHFIKGEPYFLFFGLLVGATLGGNLTPIGASANIAGIGILRKEGYEVSAKQFMKIGIPFTLAAVVTGYLLVWFIWA